MKRSEREYEWREFLIYLIEGITGSLTSIPYSEVSTVDLQKLFFTLWEEDAEYQVKKFLKETGYRIEEVFEDDEQ